MANVKNQVTQLSRTLPFLYGGQGLEWTRLGDESLVEVSVATIWGGMQPSILEVLPFEGYPEKSIATAMSIVGHYLSVLSSDIDIAKDLDCYTGMERWLLLL